MAITPLPSLDRTSPGFRASLDAFFLTQLQTFCTEANALALGMNAASAGGADSIQYTFSTTTTDSDPGVGYMRLSNATQNAATVIRLDLTDALGATQTAVLDTMDDSSSTIKGFLRVIKAGDASKWLMFALTSIATPAGYRNFTVTPVSSSSASPFADGDSVIMYFGRTGDKGDPGTTGTPGTNGTDGVTDSIGYTFSTTTTDSDPGAGLLRLSSATQDASTVLRLDLVDRFGSTQTNALDAMDDSTNTVKGILRLTKFGDPTKWLLFNLTSIASPAGYRNFTVSLISSSSSSPFSNGDNLCLHFSRSGDLGSLQRRVNTITSSSTPTPNCATTDLFTVTALAASATFGAPTGTPADGQSLMFRLKDNGTARTLAYNAIYRAGSNLALPATTIVNKTMYIGWIYNGVDSKWDLASVLDNI